MKLLLLAAILSTLPSYTMNYCDTSCVPCAHPQTIPGLTYTGHATGLSTVTAAGQTAAITCLLWSGPPWTLSVRVDKIFSNGFSQ